MNFLGRDSKNLKVYQICMETIRYHDPDCAILVGLTSSSKFARDFNCSHSPPTAVCYDHSLKIHMEPISMEKSSRNSSFLFKVVAHLTADKMELIWTLLAASGGSLVLIIIIIVSVRQIQNRLQNTKKKEVYETESIVATD
ncbi:uncharacterized protein LOC134262936 [Saccostrea cucullata]|uniref:uncharacterized protein LOC134262936 n=1 Tax=Saccostrea cuccullata TaxID=36930 RepID=UPI002ED57B9E